jgi:hypothetical protein
MGQVNVVRMAKEKTIQGCRFNKAERKIQIREDG